MLPGGLAVLGVFLGAAPELSIQAQNILRRVSKLVLVSLVNHKYTVGWHSIICSCCGKIGSTVFCILVAMWQKHEQNIIQSSTYGLHPV